MPAGRLFTSPRGQARARITKSVPFGHICCRGRPEGRPSITESVPCLLAGVGGQPETMCNTLIHNLSHPKLHCLLRPPPALPVYRLPVHSLT